MKRIVLLFFVFIYTFSFSQDISYAHRIIDTLASPYMKGRGCTFEGNKKAADFIVSELKHIGINAFKQGYEQLFFAPANVFPSEMQFILDGTRLVAGRDYIIDARSCSVHGTFKVVTLSKKVFEHKHKRKKFFKKNWDDYFVYIPPQVENLDEFKKNKDEFLFKKLNCKGVITTEKNLVYVPALEQENKVHIIVKQGIIQNPETVQVDLKAVFKPECLRQNVIGYIKGQKDTFIVVTAHLDHLGTMGDSVFFPGAHDNASGCAMVLDLARYFSKQKNLQYSMAFMFFDGEEYGLLGSYYYTENPYFPLSKIKFLLNLDLMGSGDEGIQIVNSRVYPQYFAIMKQINDSAHYLPQLKMRGAAANSDHYFFYKNGVPSFFAYSLGKYKQYHNIYDTRQNVPLSGYDGMFRLFRDFIIKLENSKK